MAIDNAEKRRSVANIPWGPGVTPNVSKDAEWRQQVPGGYSGIAAASPGGPTSNGAAAYYYAQSQAGA